MRNDLAREIIGAVENVTKDWSRQRKQEERHDNARLRRQQALTCQHKVTVKEIAYDVMEAAYRQASGRSGMANPRQIFYRARPPILERTGNESLDSMYFCQTLLVNYMLENPETTAGWDIIWDDRGHFREPHTGREIGLGTLAVRNYLGRAEAGLRDEMAFAASAADFPTVGCRNRFQAVLFIEKEGFLPLFEAVHLAEKYDLAIMSSKGLSTTAARTLVDRLCGVNSLPLLVVHDFDKSGFSIVGTIRRDNRRYSFANDVKVIDLGLRLEDVRKHDLQSEPVQYGKPRGYGQVKHPGENLRENGATDDEIEFLVSGGDSWDGYSGERVEINAFDSDSLIAWLEGKLGHHKIKKVIPDAATLIRAYRRAAVIGKLPDWARNEIDKINVPDGLLTEVQRALKNDPTLSWDAAIARMAQGNL
jgi:hypothetical protein